jgi:uncharacterized membrane protein
VIRHVRRPAGRARALLSDWTGRFVATLSTPGLLLATLFFAASLTPSLLPRTWGMQGVLSGVSLAAGYGLGVLARSAWGYLELPVPRPKAQRVVTLGAAFFSIATALVFLRTAAEWQNSIRGLMELEPVDSAHPFRVGAIATVVGVALLGFGRLFGLTFRVIQRRLDRFLPRRVANLGGGVLAVLLFWSIVNGVFFERFIRGLDASFQQVDALIEQDVAPPGASSRAGGTASLVAWDDLGRRGREFVSMGADERELRASLPDTAGVEVRTPIRVYVGLNSAASIEARARLALDELLRVGAFDRAVLVIATPTGTGWIDPGAMDALEHLHRGDVATVAVQYSYLPSWLSLLAEPEYGVETARAVFSEIYGYWTALPDDQRPELYLHGLSLGALNSERSADFYDFISDPFSGAVWSGPPFRSTTWRSRMDEREPGSPAWLPRFRDGSVVRFTNQDEALEVPGAEWGAVRIAYLQYASDPITFFEQRALYREPEWMNEPRGPDVSPELRWYPVVTMLQLAVDMMAADQSPLGYGHAYAPEHYVHAWRAVTDPPGWSDLEIERLKERLRERAEARIDP